MSRSIEFRAWDTRHFEGGEMVFNVSHFIEKEWGLDVMQYTGLLDKNGKKIFEGDKISVDRNCVIFCGGSMSSTLLVGFFYGGFCGYEQKGNNISSRPLGMLEDIEVIGNIYENHDLLIKGAI